MSGQVIDGKKWGSFIREETRGTFRYQITESFVEGVLYGPYLEEIVFDDRRVVISQGNYINGNKWGWWKENGSQGTYMAGRKVGMWLECDEEGWGMGFYTMEGERDGRWYFESLSKDSYEVTYNKGVPKKDRLVYFTSNKDVDIKCDPKMTFDEWQTFKIPRIEKEYGCVVDEKKEGWWTQTTRYTIASVFYVGGERQGERKVAHRTRYYPLKKETFKDDLLDGPFVKYRKNKIKVTGQHSKGKKEGVWQGFNRHGKRIWRRVYKAGKKDGKWTTLDKDGKEKTTFFQMGKRMPSGYCPTKTPENEKIGLQKMSPRVHFEVSNPDPDIPTIASEVASGEYEIRPSTGGFNREDSFAFISEDDYNPSSGAVESLGFLLSLTEATRPPNEYLRNLAKFKKEAREAAKERNRPTLTKEQQEQCKANKVDPEDVLMVMQQSSQPFEKSLETLKGCHNDIIDAIMKLTA